MFENPRRGRQARNFTTNVAKILDLKSSSAQIFLENWCWVPLITGTLFLKNVLLFLNGFGIRLNGLGYPFQKNCHPFERLGLCVWKKLSSVWTAWAIRSPKKLMSSVWTAWAGRLEKLSSVRTAWAICFKKLLSVRTLGLSVWKRNCQLLEELNLSVQRSILAEFLSQNHFVVATCVKRSVILQVSYTVRYEVCLQTYHEWLWISAPL